MGLDAIFANPNNDPEKDRFVAEAIALYSGIKDVLMADSAQQFSIICDVLDSINGRATCSQQSLVFALLDELKTNNIIDMLQCASPNSFLTSALRILDEYLDAQLQAVEAENFEIEITIRDNNNLPQHQLSKLGNSFERVAVLTISNFANKIITDVSRESNSRNTAKLVEFVLQLLDSLQKHLDTTSGFVNTKTQLLLEKSHLASVVPFAVFSLHALLHNLVAMKKVSLTTILDVARALAKYGTFALNDVQHSSFLPTPGALTREPSMVNSTGSPPRSPRDTKACEAHLPILDVSCKHDHITLDVGCTEATYDRVDGLRVVCVFADTTYDLSSVPEHSGNYFEVKILNASALDVAIGLAGDVHSSYMNAVSSFDFKSEYR